MMKNVILPLWSSSQRPSPPSNHENIRPIPLRDILQNILTDFPQNIQGHQKQDKSEKLSGPRGSMSSIRNAVSWMRSWNREGAFGKNGKNLNKVWTSVNNNV